MSHHVDEKRRQLLLGALAMGAFATTRLAHAGGVPSILPAGKSIYSMHGRLLVNEQIATPDTVIQANDVLKTGLGSKAIFVVGQDAFLMRENTELQLAGSNFFVDVSRLVTGKLLTVFGKRQRPHQIKTPTATLGIRGTGIYAETDEEMSYLCTCYGTVDIVADAAPNHKETVTSKHHDDPKYITKLGKIKPAPMINHTDEELMLIEALLGRTPPFAMLDEGYGGPKRY